MLSQINEISRKYMKIFVIGGHKNGTKSIDQWFIQRGLKSCHGNQWYRNKHTIKSFDCFSGLNFVVKSKYSCGDM